MKRYFAPIAAIAWLAIPFVYNVALAQKVVVPNVHRIPAPLLRRMPRTFTEKVPQQLMRRMPPRLVGKIPTQLIGTKPQTGMVGNDIAFMQQVNAQGNQNVANIYKACMSHPGACNGLASQQSLNDAIQGVQNQSLINSQHQMVNQNIQTQAIGLTNCSVTGGTVYLNRTTQQKECSH